MAAYDIVHLCKDCGREHPLLMRIYLNDGPSRKQSIAESFQGRSVPAQVAAIRGHKALCLKTGRNFTLENDDQIFLIPASFKAD